MNLDTKLRCLATNYLGWSYSLSKPYVAFSSPGIPESIVRCPILQSKPKQTNCSTFTTSLLFEAFEVLPWSLVEYGDMQVFADRLPDSPDSPIQAVERMGAGRRVPHLRAADEGWSDWHLVQGWRSLGSKPSGHAFLVKPHRRGGILVLQASSAGGPTLDQRARALDESYGEALFYAQLKELVVTD